MISEKQMASAVGAKTARACHICVKKRARWYCGADDAFLCQSCDDSVHSANPLARRHERVRLKNASAKGAGGCLPTWHRGPTRKPRTPRHPKKPAQSSNSSHHHLLVPELDTSTSMEEEEEEQLLYRVPVYEQDPYSAGAGDLGVSQGRWFLQAADFDMADFAADVEALLGKGLDEEHACGIEDLGLLINPHERDDSSAIKFEKEEEEVEEMEVIREPFELSFDYDSPADLKVAAAEPVEGIDYEEKKEWKMLLRLDYDAVSNSWGSQGSPWTNGKRPDFSPHDDFWPLLGDCGTEMQGSGEIKLMVGGQIGGSRGGDGGREARVSRYREKRRTRLFSKKIRYEVRKLNAEKRPRMKGRFVKRSSFPLLTK